MIKSFIKQSKEDLSEELLHFFHRLSCRYTSETHPFLKFAPFKVEMLYINPDIVLFHDVLYDYEIKTIKELAKPLVSPDLLLFMS